MAISLGVYPIFRHTHILSDEPALRKIIHIIPSLHAALQQDSRALGRSRCYALLCYIQECTCSKGTVLVCAVCEAWASLAGPTSGIVEKVPSISLSDERLKQVAEHYGVSTAQAREGDRKSRAWDFSSHGTLSFLHRCHPRTLCEFPGESSSNFRFAIK